MEAIELPLYPRLQESKPKFITQEIPDTNPLTPFENVLNSIFPGQTEENKIIKTRRILGETAKSLSDEQIQCIVSEFQFLIDSWLDEYERKVFRGITLKEVLNEK